MLDLDLSTLLRLNILVIAFAGTMLIVLWGHSRSLNALALWGLAMLMARWGWASGRPGRARWWSAAATP